MDLITTLKKSRSANATERKEAENNLNLLVLDLDNMKLCFSTLLSNEVQINDKKSLLIFLKNYIQDYFVSFFVFI